MLLLENVEDLIAQDCNAFKSFIEEVYERCEHLSIIMCSYEWIGHINKSIIPTIFHILELDTVSSVNLFIERTGELKAEEVFKLVLANPENCL